jgi:predicted dehydrogenase
MVMDALKSGAKLIWAEKPFANSAASARRMMAAAEAHGARIFVGFQRRYGAPF